MIQKKTFVKNRHVDNEFNMLFGKFATKSVKLNKYTL